MGIINNGILGGLSGKVSGVVGSNWKGIKTLRAYAKPSNPKTVAQTSQRNKFTSTVQFAKSILASVINIYWKNKNAFMSNFNSFMKTNVSLTNSVEGININNLLTTGSLEGATLNDVLYSGSQVEADFSTTTQSNGLATDNVLFVVYDKANKISFVADAIDTRFDGSTSVNVGSGRNAANLIAFLSFYRGSDKDLLVSTSTASSVSAI